jgi:mannose-1-phosphate guanylyltransferase
VTVPAATRHDVEAVVLVGGQGTRLRPLTLSAPKPMLPTAGVPFLEHMLSRIRDAGMQHVVLATSFQASTFEKHFGNGAAFGLEIDYVFEDVPLGTGGAIRNVLEKLSAPTVMVFNGDILSGVDLGALLATHRRHGADATLHLVEVQDPKAFGCVTTDVDGVVTAFLEKSDDPPTNTINAGCYVLDREVIAAIDPDRVVSVEREVFPSLISSGRKLVGHVTAEYWLDLGTPAAFVQGSADLVRGIAPSGALHGHVGESMVLPGAMVSPAATLRGGTTIGADVTVEAGADVDGSVIFDGAHIGSGAVVTRSVIGHGVVVGSDAVISDAVIGDHAVVGAGCELRHGMRVWPSVVLEPGSIRFSAPG